MQIDKAIDAGAQFIFTPDLDAELVEYAQEKNISIFPGGITPSDYHPAYKYGLKVLKFFSAEQSGGISLKNLEEYLKCPIICACGGSCMVMSDIIDNQKWDKILELCQKIVEIV